MSCTTHPLRPGHRESGLTLIELMVGLTIGLLCSLLIFQSLALWDSRNRTTTSSSDVQIAGTLAMYQMDRDFKLAGMGFGMALAPFAGCLVTTPDATFSPRLAAVSIIQGTANAPDVIRVFYGNANYMTSGQALDGSTASTKVARVRAGFNQGDRIVAAGTNTAGATFCTLIEMTGIPATGDDGKTLNHTSSVAYTSYYDQKAHVSSANNSTGTWSGSITGRLFNLGPTPVLAEWQISTAAASLTRSNRFEFNASTGEMLPPSPVDVAQGVVDLQAMYGVDANNNGRIEDAEWIEDDSAIADWTQLRAIRVALLLRGEKYEPDLPDQAAPTWFNGTRTFAMTNVGGGADTNAAGPSNWRRYRYRVYENIIPLRNMIWGNSAPL